MSAIIRSLTVRVGADLTKFDKSMKALERQMNKTGRTLSAAGSSLTSGITIPLIGIGVAAFKMGKDFEAAMSKVTGLVGVAKDQTEAWGKDILEMAPKLGKAPAELANGLFFVTSAGIKGAAAMDTLEKSAKASVAGLGDVAVVADMATSAMNAYGQENLSAGTAIDILTAAVREGKLEAETLAPSLGQLLPMASAMNISFSQVAGSMAVMSRTGSEAAESATQLSSIMMFLQKPADEAVKMLDGVGLSMQGLRDMAQQQPDGLIQVMRLLDESFVGNDEALATIIPNIRAFRGVMNVLAQDVDVVDGVINNVTNSSGMMEEAFNAAADTTEFKWQQSIVGVQTSLISLWDTLQKSILPIIEGFNEKIKDITYSFNQLDENQKENIIRFAALAAAIGPVMLLSGKLLIALPKLRAAFSLLISPVGLVMAALAALTIATVTVIKKFGELRDEINKTTDDNINSINEQRDQNIQAYKDITEAQKSELKTQLSDAKLSYDERVREIVKFKTDSIAEEKERLNELLNGAEKAHEDAIDLIREEYGYVKSTTKSKTDITNDYYDNIKKQANDAYAEAIRLIDEELALKMALLDEETTESIKAIQKQIDNINSITEAEEKNLKEQTEAKKLASLEDALARAWTIQDRKNAQDELDEYLTEQERERLLTLREEQIAALETEISEIKASGEEKAEELESQAKIERDAEAEKLESSLLNIDTKRDYAIQAIQAERIAVEEEALKVYESEVKSLEDKIALIDNGTAHFIEKLDEEVEDLKASEAEKYAVLVEYHNKAVSLLDEKANLIAQDEARQAGILATQEMKKGEELIAETMTLKNALDRPKWVDVLFGPTIGSAMSTINVAKLIKFKADEKQPREKELENNLNRAMDLMKDLPQFEQGGIVNVPLGAPTLAIVHGGEEIIPANNRGNASGSPSIIINANYNITDKQTAEYANKDLMGQLQTKLATRGVMAGAR